MSRFAGLLSRYRVEGDPLRSQRMVELAVIVLLLILALQLVWGISRLIFLPSPAAISPAADALAVLPMRELVKVPVEASNEMRKRPLFWVSRRPLEEQATLVDASFQDKDKATPQELKNIKLLGVFGSEESTGIIAFVKGKKRRIMQGEVYEGWTLDSVQANEVVFKDGARAETLVLKQAVITAPPPVVAAPVEQGQPVVDGAATAVEKSPASSKPAKPAAPAPPARLGFEGR